MYIFPDDDPLEIDTPWAYYFNINNIIKYTMYLVGC